MSSVLQLLIVIAAVGGACAFAALRAYKAIKGRRRTCCGSAQGRAACPDCAGCAGSAARGSCGHR